MSYSVFDISERNTSKEPRLFLGPTATIARYDKVRYPQFLKLARKQEGFFWQPEEVSLERDIKDFKSLTKEEEHIFTSNLKRQILLDSVQGRALSLAFGPVTSDPELEGWWKVQEYFERIHNRTYSYLLQNVYPNPSKVFDEMLEIQEIVDCAKSVSKEYDRLIDYNATTNLSMWSPSRDYKYAVKEQIWRTIHAVNALEGIRFYVSFICSWAFAEQGKMEGNAKLIKFIARDENIHLGVTQQLIKLLPKDDPEFERIQRFDAEYIQQLFTEVVNQEKAWAKYLFSTGSMLGLNEEILYEYVDYIAAKRARAVGIQGFKNVQNPLPWDAKWIAGAEIQVAPQETQINSYTVGDIKNDASSDSFKGFSL
jgi:ribonucleoside-diphosphate reductase beta chain